VQCIARRSGYDNCWEKGNVSALSDLVLHVVLKMLTLRKVKKFTNFHPCGNFGTFRWCNGSIVRTRNGIFGSSYYGVMYAPTPPAVLGRFPGSRLHWKLVGMGRVQRGVRLRHPIQAVFGHAGRRQWWCRLRSTAWRSSENQLPATRLPRSAPHYHTECPGGKG
jgi:hypothetical protein